MGVVYLANQLFPTPEAPLREVAVKTIRPELVESLQALGLTWVAATARPDVAYVALVRGGLHSR